MAQCCRNGGFLLGPALLCLNQFSRKGGAATSLGTVMQEPFDNL